ncbi:MAG: 16S rRNA (cytidine(1402)-2'-O)-methyltransferase [bacterium]
MIIKSGLYVTATPIGNLQDMTFRAVEIMRKADLILCEDKRVTARLCHAYEVKTPLKAYHDHNGERVRPEIMQRLDAQEVIVLVSDAGTPLISDPGYKLVRAVHRAGHQVFTVPGASALTAALSISGAPSDRFLFAGFPPAKAPARQKFLQDFSQLPAASLIFYETGPRLAASLSDMAALLGNRCAAIARELTKLHEEVRQGKVLELAEFYRQQPPKGEIVIILHPADRPQWSDADVSALLTDLLQNHSVKDAASEAVLRTGWPRKQLYSMALALKTEGE